MKRAAVLIALFFATGALLTAIPVGTVWIASRMTDSIAEHFVAALPLTVLAMTVGALLVAWLNQLYLRTNGTLARLEADGRAGWKRTRIGGPAEPLLIFWFFVAMIAMFGWFFFLAENPSIQVI